MIDDALNETDNKLEFSIHDDIERTLYYYNDSDALAKNIILALINH